MKSTVKGILISREMASKVCNTLEERAQFISLYNYSKNYRVLGKGTRLTALWDLYAVSFEFLENRHTKIILKSIYGLYIHCPIKDIKEMVFDKVIGVWK